MAWFTRRQNESKKAMERLETRLSTLEHSLQELLNRGISYEITIEELNIHDPYLDHLTFRFDKLDVKEVSGALNLGNNFGVNVHQGEKKKNKSKSENKSADAEAKNPSVNITGSDKRPPTSKNPGREKPSKKNAKSRDAAQKKARNTEEIKIQFHPAHSRHQEH